MNQITIKNQYISLTALNYGAIIQRLEVVDCNNVRRNIVVGFEDKEQYLDNPRYLGACVGRFAGRISQEHITINDQKYPLSASEGIHLHGGVSGFDQKYWIATVLEDQENPTLEFYYTSKDMEEGYPGNLKVTVQYILEKFGLRIIHKATTDKTTVLNLTNHSCFRLDDAPEIDHYLLSLNASEYLELRDNKLPTGNLLSTKDSEFDFQKSKKIGQQRFDTPFVLSDNTLCCAEVSSSQSGIAMEVYTNQPALVVFTPTDFPGICFETQNYPDAPHQKHFPTAVLQPEETYYHETFFKFGFVN